MCYWGIHFCQFYQTKEDLMDILVPYFKAGLEDMTISDRRNADELENRVRELTAELEKANHKQEEHTHRYNQILEGINRILSNVTQAKTEEELANACLSVALEVTDSLIGFINLVDADGLLHDIAISDMGWEQCLMYGKIGHRRPPERFCRS